MRWIETKYIYINKGIFVRKRKRVYIYIEREREIKESLSERERDGLPEGLVSFLPSPISIAKVYYLKFINLLVEVYKLKLY